MVHAVANSALAMLLYSAAAAGQTAAPADAAGLIAPNPADAGLAATLVPYRIVGDSIDAPLTAVAGDAVRGRAIVANRQVGLCLLCHAGPIPEQRFQGNLAPDLSGVGSQASAGTLRLRMVDARRLNPETIMPSYYRTDGLTRVAPALQGKPLLNAQQIEDVVAYLQTLTMSNQTETDAARK